MMRGLLIAAVFWSGAAFAQSTPDPDELASVRGELTALNGQIESLRAQLLSNAAGQGVATSGPALQRLDQLELELRRITGNVEALRRHVSQIVEDGTRRIGDLEFRLVELEGGDISTLGETSTLGGVAPAPVTGTEMKLPDTGAELAVVEREDFEAALAALKGGDAASAANGFDQFLSAYPGGPLSASAMYYLGEARFAQSNWAGAARSYLASFQGYPNSEHAPTSLYKVGLTLGKLGQVKEACLTFNETEARYPGHPTLSEVFSAKEMFSCGS